MKAILYTTDYRDVTCYVEGLTLNGLPYECKDIHGAKIFEEEQARKIMTVSNILARQCAKINGYTLPKEREYKIKVLS